MKSLFILNWFDYVKKREGEWENCLLLLGFLFWFIITNVLKKEISLGLLEERQTGVRGSNSFKIKEYEEYWIDKTQSNECK